MLGLLSYRSIGVSAVDYVGNTTKCNALFPVYVRQRRDTSVCITHLNARLNETVLKAFYSTNIKLYNIERASVTVYPVNELPHFNRMNHMHGVNKLFSPVIDAKLIVLLPRPYQSDCRQYSDGSAGNGDPKSRSECMVEAMARQERHTCGHNRYWSWSRLAPNESIRDIVNRINTSDAQTDCYVRPDPRALHRECKIGCDYYERSVAWSNSNLNAHHAASSIKLMQISFLCKRYVSMVWRLFPKMSIVDYLCSAGGLMGMYLGLSIESALTLVINKSQTYVRRLTNQTNPVMYRKITPICKSLQISSVMVCLVLMVRIPALVFPIRVKDYYINNNKLNRGNLLINYAFKSVLRVNDLELFKRNVYDYSQSVVACYFEFAGGERVNCPTHNTSIYFSGSKTSLIYNTFFMHDSGVTTKLRAKLLSKNFLRVAIDHKSANISTLSVYAMNEWHQGYLVDLNAEYNIMFTRQSFHQLRRPTYRCLTENITLFINGWHYWRINECIKRRVYPINNCYPLYNYHYIVDIENDIVRSGRQFCSHRYHNKTYFWSMLKQCQQSILDTCLYRPIGLHALKVRDGLPGVTRVNLIPTRYFEPVISEQLATDLMDVWYNMGGTIGVCYAISNDVFKDMKSDHDFTGKVVLTTGSSSGIGEGIVKLFSLLGANVVVTGRKVSEISRVAKEAQQLSPKKLKPLEVVADVGKSDDLKRLLNETIKTYGKLDVLVNNAGIGQFIGIRDPNLMSVFDKTIHINLRSFLELIQLSVPYLDQTNGTIISISSIAAFKPYINIMSKQSALGLAYQASKAGVDVMSRALALELGPKIRVNVINPGPVITNFFNNNPMANPKAAEKLFSNMMSKITMKRLGSALDIAKGVVYLASPDAAFITGANLVIDGVLSSKILSRVLTQDNI
ncbi:unnamed protein product [Medioppia subpectinata]|uniref:Uncharacterized protein n=1 Tax=Medioppia subpectinata TaxID=1979941 RepID=A0A7R9KRI9_9ACAR|nr:unnamed protein product [Medioppia subpectinata]CAG2107293.1 unnamed protein product [Medioppia subpectinata]